ncbi:MAG TPA: tetratricopeptide repeat protein [Longimicrobiaceae bacterium]|nr:tetratricopeptide repeat protein [Longimicrobiaceae bacterium]
MKFRSGIILAFAGLALAGCAGATVPAGPVTSPTGETYPPGTEPSESDFSGPAQLFLAQAEGSTGEARQNLFQQALDQAEQGIAADSANPLHYFLAARAQAGLGNYEVADDLFERAEEIYPAYELEIDPAREVAWAAAFNEGVNAYNEGDVEGAIAAWSGANIIFDKRGEAALNLGVVYTQRGEHEKAVQAYRDALAALERTPTRELMPEEVTAREETRASVISNLAQLLIFTEQYAEAEELYRAQLEADPNNVELQSELALALSKQGKTAEANAIYESLLTSPDLSGNEIFNVGVALFNSQNFAQAAEAFKRVTDLMPNSRDAWYNYANALYAMEDFVALVPVAVRLVELDPLNENAALILARAYRDTEQQDLALEVLRANAAVPIHVEQLQMGTTDTGATVRGTVVGTEAGAGQTVQLLFTFYGAAGQIGTETVTVTAPGAEASTDFEVEFQSAEPVMGYSYELVG